MSLPRRKSPRLSKPDDELLEELSRQKPAEVQKLRSHERLELRLVAELRPANLSAGSDVVAKGHTLDVSPGGCRARLSSPPVVGDIYRMHLVVDGRDLPRVHALCMRTVLVGEAEVEAAFQFLSPLEDEGLFAQDPQSKGDLLS